MIIQWIELMKGCNMNEILNQNDAKEYTYYKNAIKQSITEFMNYTQSEDIMGIILRAQIYIEKDLDLLLRKLLIHPEKISLQYFSAKLDAAYALGAIDDDWYGSFRKFNKIRNKYAHDLNYTFTENDYNDLVSTLSKNSKEEFKYNLSQEEWFNSLMSSLGGESKNIDFKYKLRILLSDFMLYMMQQHQSIEHLWKEICCTKQIDILNEKIELLKNLNSNPE
jgi:hypothetical protein